MAYDGPNPIVVNAGGTGSSSFTAYGPVVAASTTTGALTSVTPSATSGVPFISKGSSTLPAFGTAVVAGGGTGIITTTAYGVICGGTTATVAFQNAGAGTSGQLLQSGGASALPAYTTSTYPATNAANTLLYASSANTMAALATADNGVLITSAAGVPSILAAGTTGQVLTATTGSPPSWVAPAAASGNLVLLLSQTASASSSLAFSSTYITNTYNTYVLFYSNYVASGSDNLLITVSTNNGSTYASTGYQSGVQYWAYNSATVNNQNSTSSFIVGVNNTNTGDQSSGVVYLTNVTNGNSMSIYGNSTIYSSAYGNATYAGGCSTVSVNNIKLSQSGGTMTTGTFTLYGLIE